MSSVEHISESRGPAEDEVLAGAGDLAARMRSFDWAHTPLGPVQDWPQSLRTCVRIVLTSRQPMFVWWGPELINLYNDAYRSILGGKHPQALGQPASVVWREIWDQVEPRAATAMETREGTYDEALLLIMERNGYPEETYYTFSYSPVPNDQGGTGGIICANTDDTQRIIGERQLRTLRELAANTVNARTNDEACELSAHALRTNRRDLPFAMLYLFNADRSRVHLAASTGIHGHEIAPDWVTSESGWLFAEALSAHSQPIVSDVSGIAALPTGDWQAPPTKAVAIPIAGSGQTNQGGILIVGLNPYRVLDDNYRGFLELVAGQISSSIASAQAYEEERRRAAALAELDRAKTAFFSNVSHELRTPLTLMLGPIEDSLAEKVQDSARKERLELLHRNAVRLLKLVNALLDFSRIEAGRVRASYEATDLGRFTVELASIFRSAVERAGLRMVTNISVVPEPVFVDREMWEKIVLNLLSNALKSTFEGGIEISLRSTGEGVQLTVQDTGTGIPEEEIPHLFERFRRVEGARRRTHEGSGIGLALVHELVGMHRGTIEVESKMGTGTTFRVWIPLGTAHLPPERVQKQPALAASAIGATAYVEEAMSWLPGGKSQNGALAPSVEVGSMGELTASSDSGSARVLLVDDNRDMREYVSRLLSRRFQVTTAVNGKEALRQAIADPPDLVLSDVMMPEMDGFELLSALRKDAATKTIPVVLLSARAGEESRIEGLEAGADDYLVKPFTARELMARVDSHIRIARFRQEAHEHEASLVQQLHDTQRMAAEALEQISDGFWTYDSDFRITYMNAAAVNMSRRKRGEQVGKVIWELFPGLLGSDFENRFRRVMGQRTSDEFEYFYEPWQRWYALRVYPAPNQGIAVYMRDITEAKKTERALRRAEQLAAAGRLAASISHELNNPLEAVTNLLFLAKSDPAVNGHLKEMLDIADRELQRLSHIASKSLKFYRQSTSPSQVQMSELLDSVLFFYEARLKNLHIDVDKRYSPAPSVLCFSGEIQQVFTNLISNAIDAMEKNGKLFLRVRQALVKGVCGVRVTVADTGSGISPETKRNLFQPFYTTKDETGTGLGLWVTSGILQKHRATMKVRSRVNEGAVFSLFIPLQGMQAQIADA